MKVLVITSEPISGKHLRTALGSSQLDDAELMIVAPALAGSAIRFWVSDVDDAIARASSIELESAERLRSEDVDVHGDDTGEADLSEAIRDALATLPAERVVVFMHRTRERRYREQIDPASLADELRLPVDVVPIEPAGWPPVSNGRPAQNGNA
ncbi:MAG: hypothetical protein ACYDA6_09000 [Solirubrobacteraceae bacterium]